MNERINPYHYHALSRNNVFDDTADGLYTIKARYHLAGSIHFGNCLGTPPITDITSMPMAMALLILSRWLMIMLSLMRVLQYHTLAL